MPAGDEPPPGTGEYIGTANTTIMMTDRDTGQDIPAPPGSRLYLRSTPPVAGIDTTVRVGSLREVEKIPARIVTSVPEGDTLGIRPGDVIAERQPVGYTDREGEVVVYADAGISLPDSASTRRAAGCGARPRLASGPVTSYDVPGETFSEHGPERDVTVGYRTTDQLRPRASDISQPRPRRSPDRGRSQRTTMSAVRPGRA